MARNARTILCITLAVLLAGTLSPAFGGPTAVGAAAGALRTAKRALGIAKQADKRSKIALKAAQKTGPAGPRGDRGPRGSEGLDGIPGERGPKGSTGATGALGAIGPTGAAGQDGPTGPAGRDGIDGERGATGPPGPTNSVSVTQSSTTDISTDATVIDLASAHDGGTDRQITTTYSARIMAFASIQARNPSADPRDVRCMLFINDGTTETPLGQEYAFDLPAQDGFDVSGSLQGAASKPAGTYNVRLACHELDGNSLTAIRANLAVFASDG